MTRQTSVWTLIGPITQFIEQLAVQHSYHEPKRGVGIRDDDEQCRGLIPDGIQMELIF